MGEFLAYGSNSPPPGLGGKGLFGAPPPPTPSGFTSQFLITGANNATVGLANAAFASVRDTSGVWHPVDVSALGARGAFGAFINPAATEWLIATNDPLGQNALLGVLPFNTAALSSAIDTGLSGGRNLTAMTTNPSGPLTLIGTLLNEVVTTPDLAAFTTHPANGPGSYTITGITRDGPPVTLYVAVGVGSGGTGVITSSDGSTWVLNTVSFISQGSALVTSNNVIWDGGIPNGGVGFVAVSGNSMITSPDGVTFTVHSIAASTSGALCVAFDNFNTSYVLTASDGKVHIAGTPNDYVTGAATHLQLSTHPIRCAIADSVVGIDVVGDSAGAVWTSPDTLNWTQEDPGLGNVVLTSAANLQGV